MQKKKKKKKKVKRKAPKRWRFSPDDPNTIFRRKRLRVKLLFNEENPIM